MSEQAFRSPVSKLLAFFLRSRNRWKDKCKQAKKELKSLKTCHAKLKTSRDYWKQLARQVAESVTPQEAEVATTKTHARTRSARRRTSCSAACEAGGH